MKILGLFGIFLAVLGSARGEEGRDQQRLLFIGDSHTVGSFGRRADQLFRAWPGHELAIYGSCGTSPHSWFNGDSTTCGFFYRGLDGKEYRGSTSPTPLIKTLLADQHPAVTIVALGANLYGAPPDFSARTSEQLANAIAEAGSRCLWVGPPRGRNKPEPGLSVLIDTIRAATRAHCTFVDSRPSTYYPDVGGDGVHFDQLGPAGAKIAENWALSIFNDIREILDINSL